jgi:hypothetical protein
MLIRSLFYVFAMHYSRFINKQMKVKFDEMFVNVSEFENTA